MRSFATLAAGTCPPHEEMLLATAAELAPVDLDLALARLDALAAALPEPSGSPEADLRAVAMLLRDRLPARPEGALTLPQVLADGSGHPLAVAGAGAAAATRRGLEIDVVGAGGKVWLAHPDASPLLVDVAAGGMVDGRLLEVDLFWRCAHELAQLTLERIVDRAERRGDIAFAIHAARLGTELPLEDGPAGPEQRLKQVEARLN